MNWWKWLLSLIALMLTAATAVIFTLLYLSLPQYEGEQRSGIANAARLERDALGYLSIHAANRNDAAFALGFAHGQERFFQMDLLRRSAAGELSALFGARAVTSDKTLRQHRFRQRAQSALAQLTAAENQLLSEYSRGVNHGLAALKVRPFEYLLLRQQPERWQNADSFLVIYAMYLDLQGKLGRDDYAMTVLKQSIPTDWYRFLQQESDIWQAALDHSLTAPVSLPDSPYPALLRQQLSSCIHCQVKDATDIGSNNFAVAGSLTAHGGAILADDMHLSSRVPGIWYKAQLNWRDGDNIRTVTGLTLPGAPAVVVGSNGKLAWGFTNSTADWHDLVALKLSDDGKRYLTADGWQNLQYYYETIKVAGGADQTVELAETQWGPLVRFGDSPAYALSWVGYDSQAVNFNLLALEQATTTEQALALAPSFGIPSQNLLAADSKGAIGWRLTNRIPKRQLDDFDTAQDWSDGRQGWFGLIDEAQQLSVSETDRLWTANARMIGGEFYQLIGSGGYDLGARGWQIEQGLNALVQADEQALHAIQLDNRALMLERWRELLLTVLTNEVVSAQQLQAYRQHIVASSQRAAADDVGYSLVRAFRLKLLELQFAPLSAYLEQHGAKSQDLKYSLETPLWAMLQQRRTDTLPDAYASWDALLLDAVLHSKTQLEQQYGSLNDSHWGNINRARISHPLASAVPVLGDWLNMPATPLKGDSHMPRVQRPGFGQSQRMVVAPGQEQLGILTIPAGQSGHPLSPFYRSDHQYWLNEVALPFLPGEKKYQLLLTPQG
ncbi:penicillin acylase family protein [Rheinheimera nanhaiensis]|uniref:Penicillin amidase n=1 Tax=Rheinheimera nanhaiensis E407-8 TaxID=562729 RepID=I1DWT2_9GAMM|nr:penicillin acylase family protein [Rheinheimera nanhaiensis]GAB58510.1 penicillin amidase [Rheinheimera nanhaiensis E407-8]